MRLKNSYIIALAAFLCCSCSSVRHTADTVPVEARIVSYTVADMDVMPVKASQTFSWPYNPFVRVSIEREKSNTEARLLKETNCDVLVEPQYIITKRGFLRGGSITVTGYPAKYSNFHKMTTEESILFKNNNSEQPKKEKKKRLFFF